MSEDTGYIDEHAPRDRDESDPKREGYNPSPEEEKLVRMVKGLFTKAKRKKDAYSDKWLDYYKLFRGKQWDDHRPSWMHSEVFNLIWQTLQSTVPLETDSRPQIQFLPTEPSDTEFAQIMNEVSEADWDRYNWLMKLTEVVWDKNIYGTGLSEMGWDPDADYGAGSIYYRSADPFFCYPDPSASEIYENCGYFIKAEPMYLTKAKVKWSEKAKYLFADTEDITSQEKTQIEILETKSTVDRDVVVEQERPDEWGENRILVLTAYILSDDMEEVEQEQEDENGKIKKLYVLKKKYPNGRKIVIANNMVLEDGEMECGKIPFQKVQNYILPREFWGASEIEPLEGPQRIFNSLVCYALDVLHLTGNPIWIVDTTAGIDTDHLFNRPGDVIEKEPDSEVRREQGANLQPYVLQLIDRLKEWFEQIGGSMDVTRGVNPTGVTAASAIEMLQEAGQTRVRQKLRLLDMYLQDVAQLYADLAMKYYTAPRTFRLTNDQNVNKYFKFHVEPQEDGTTRAYLSNYRQEGKQFVEQPPDVYLMRAKLDIKASTGSGLPFQKAEREQRVTRLFELGIIDAEEVLNAIEYPNADIVMQRMREKAAAEAQQQPPPQ